eukprot:scaffold7100_cov138-Skeletonema_marinoi.AAC.3
MQCEFEKFGCCGIEGRNASQRCSYFHIHVTYIDVVLERELGAGLAAVSGACLIIQVTYNVVATPIRPKRFLSN